MIKTQKEKNILSTFETDQQPKKSFKWTELSHSGKTKGKKISNLIQSKFA